jgi:hypothetical protein
MSVNLARNILQDYLATQRSMGNGRYPYVVADREPVAQQIVTAYEGNWTQGYKDVCEGYEVYRRCRDFGNPLPVDTQMAILFDAMIRLRNQIVHQGNCPSEVKHHLDRQITLQGEPAFLELDRADGMAWCVHDKIPPLENLHPKLAPAAQPLDVDHCVIS